MRGKVRRTMAKILLMFFVMYLLSFSIASFIQANGALTGDDIAAQAKELIARYKQGDPGDHYYKLTITSDERLVPVFLEVLNDTDAKIRILAISQLSKYRKKEAIGPIAQLLRQDKNAGVRAAAALSLGRYRAAESSADLLNALNDESPRVVRAAIRGLGRLKSKEAVEPLKANLSIENKKNWAVRRAAKDALESIIGEVWRQHIRKIPAEFRLRDEDITFQAYELAMENLGNALGKIGSANSIEGLTADEEFFRDYAKTAIVIEGYYLKQNAEIYKKALENARLSVELGEMTNDDVTKANATYNQAQARYENFLANSVWAD